LEFNVANALTFTNPITGTGALNMNNTNLILTLGNTNNSFAGNVNINLGILVVSNAASLGSGVKNVVATARGSEISLRGTTTTPVTLGTNLTLFLSNDGGAAGPAVLPAAIVNVSGTNTILGPIFMPFGGGVPLIIVSNGYLVIAGPSISSDGTANARSLTLTGVGGLISAPFVDNTGQTAFPVVNSGVWTFTSANTSVGTMAVGGGKAILNGSWQGGLAQINTNGTLSGTGSASNLTVSAGGKFVPGDYGSIGSFTVSNLLSLQGATYISLNKSLAQSNTIVNIITVGTTNVTANTGSSLVVSNLGPALVAGDAFYVFNQGVTNGNLVSITSGFTLASGLVLSNYLAVDGSIKVVQTINQIPGPIQFSVSGNTLTLSWPTNSGWTLQAQTNALSVGLSTNSANWFDVPNSSLVTTTNITINRTNPAVFYRLRL
jgi:hypothetical protein